MGRRPRPAGPHHPPRPKARPAMRLVTSWVWGVIWRADLDQSLAPHPLVRWPLTLALSPVLFIRAVLLGVVYLLALWWPLTLFVGAMLLLSLLGGGSRSGGGGGFCASHECISSFDSGRGSIVQCMDGMWSHSGGLPGACSYHGGER